MSSECVIWNDKHDKELGDFLWFAIVIGLIIIFIGLTRIYSIFWLLVGFLVIWLGFMFFAYSWILGGLVVFAGIVALFMLINES